MIAAKVKVVSSPRDVRCQELSLSLLFLLLLLLKRRSCIGRRKSRGACKCPAANANALTAIKLLPVPVYTAGSLSNRRLVSSRPSGGGCIRLSYCSSRLLALDMVSTGQ
ncbi:hypothetical protein J3F83DRAFT_196078 [Trichoderma novae-zelandiae]